MELRCGLLVKEALDGLRHLAQPLVEVVDLNLEDLPIETGLRSNGVEGIEPTHQCRDPLRRGCDETVDLGFQRVEFLLDGAVRDLAESPTGLPAAVDGQQVNPGAADLLDGPLHPPHDVGVRSGDPVDPAVAPERQGRARIEKTDHRAAHVVGGVGVTELPEGVDHPGRYSMRRGVGDDDGRLAIEADPGFLRVAEGAIGVVVLPNDAEDDLGLVLLPEPNEGLLQPNLLLPDGRLECLLVCGGSRGGRTDLGWHWTRCFRARSGRRGRRTGSTRRDHQGANRRPPVLLGVQSRTRASPSPSGAKTGTQASTLSPEEGEEPSLLLVPTSVPFFPPTTEERRSGPLVGLWGRILPLISDG